MESLSEILQRSTDPDSPKPVPTTCRCGAEIEPEWRAFPPRGWHIAETCPACETLRRMREDANREAEKESAFEASIANRRASVAGSPRALLMTFDTFEPKTPSQVEALDAVITGRSVWLWGRPGCGKTHLATAAALEAVKPDHRKNSLGDTCTAWPSVERWLVADLMAVLRDGAMHDSVEQTVEDMRECDLLVLDDLGVERPTPFVLEALYRIIDSRYENDRRTIVTSNGAPSELARTLGARIHSRLVGMCEVIHVEGADGRLTR